MSVTHEDSEEANDLKHILRDLHEHGPVPEEKLEAAFMEIGRMRAVAGILELWDAGLSRIGAVSDDPNDPIGWCRTAAGDEVVEEGKRDDPS